MPDLLSSIGLLSLAVLPADRALGGRGLARFAAGKVAGQLAEGRGPSLIYAGDPSIPARPAAAVPHVLPEMTRPAAPTKDGLGDGLRALSYLVTTEPPAALAPLADGATAADRARAQLERYAADGGRRVRLYYAGGGAAPPSAPRTRGPR